MRPGDVPPPVPERVANLKIREDRTVQEFQSNSEKMHRATYEDAYTRAWFNYCRNVFPQSVRKTGTNTDIYNVSTYQCGILFNNMGSFNRKSDFRKAEDMSKPVTQGEKFNVTGLSLLREFWANNDAHVILTVEADAYQQMKRSCLRTMAWWDATQAEAMTCQSTQELIPQDIFLLCGNQMMTDMDMRQSLMSSLAKRQKEQPHNRVSDRLSSSLTPWSLLR